jgi:hypothetical protein
MTNDPALMQVKTCNSLLYKFATCCSFTPLSGPIFLTLEEVVGRYRGQVSEGTLRNWRSMRIGPSFIKIGKAVLYPLEELDRWDRRNLVVCRPSRSLPVEKAAEGDVLAERDDLAEKDIDSESCYNVIVETRESDCVTLRVYHDL